MKVAGRDAKNEKKKVIGSRAEENEGVRLPHSY